MLFESLWNGSAALRPPKTHRFWPLAPLAAPAVPDQAATAGSDESKAMVAAGRRDVMREIGFGE